MFSFQGNPDGVGGTDPQGAATAAVRDAAWISRIRQGDQAAFNALVRAYTPVLVRVAAAVVHSDDTAQDAVQEMFLRLWRQRATLTIYEGVRRYLLRSVRNQAISHHRSEVSTHHRETVWADERGMVNVRNGGEEALASESLRQEVWIALSFAPPRAREIFFLNWESGLSYAEIAEALGISIATVRNQMSRAGGLLAKHFQL